MELTKAETELTRDALIKYLNTLKSAMEYLERKNRYMTNYTELSKKYDAAFELLLKLDADDLPVSA